MCVTERDEREGESFVSVYTKHTIWAQRCKQKIYITSSLSLAHADTLSLFLSLNEEALNNNPL